MEKRLTSTWHSIRKNQPIYNLYTSSWGNPVVSAMIRPAILPYHLPLSDLGNFRDAQMQFVSAVYLVRWWPWIFLDHIHDDFDSNIRNLNNVGSFAEKQDSWQSFFFYLLKLFQSQKKRACFEGVYVDRIGLVSDDCDWLDRIRLRFVGLSLGLEISWISNSKKFDVAVATEYCCVVSWNFAFLYYRNM